VPQQQKGYPNNLFTECSQYYVGNSSTGAVRPMTTVSGVDDQRFLVDQFEQLLLRAVAQSRPFLATLFFHGVHIPYVATPEMRAKYQRKGMDENAADYWGTIEQIDSAVGRVRSLLKGHGLAESTWVSITADNGPEVSPQGGQGTSDFPNPGRTAGLRGRKRDATGTRDRSGPRTLPARCARRGSGTTHHPPSPPSPQRGVRAS
jgi:arylsulfatase A-like enzyme